MTEYRPRSSREEEPLRELLAAVVESSDDAIITKTLDGIITTWNPAAGRLLGYASSEAIGKHITMLIPRDRHSEEGDILARLKAGQRIEHYETVRLTKSETLLDVALTISPIRDSSGRIVGASKIMRNITDKKRMERLLQELTEERERLLQSETAARQQAEHSSASKDEFLAILSHELRTPLNAILGWTQVLRSSKPAQDDIAKALEVIERNTRLQMQLVEDLLDMSRIVSGKMRLDVQSVMPFGFVETAAESQRPLAEAKGVRLEVILDPSAGPVTGDSARLQQVVWNLIGNAIKFTQKGGRVQVMLERVNSHIEITVADTGVGISAELLPHIFERFRSGDSSFSRRQGGLGLGLAIAKHIIDLHGGSIQVKSAGTNEGATFRVQLPLAVVHRHTASDRLHPRAGGMSSVPVAEVDLSGLTILAVDDEPDALDVLSRILGNVGAKVATAGSGPEALALVARERPNIVICDIGMPEMDGFELMRRFREQDAKRGERLPVIALTAFARSEDRTRALLAGFIAHVSKPVEATEIVALVASLTGRTR